MRESNKIIDGLRRALKAKSVTYAVLAKNLSLSEVSVKRLLTGKTPLTLSRLDDICDALGISLSALVKLGRDDDQEMGQAHMSWEQEAALASDIKLLFVFTCLTRGLTLAAIPKKYNLTLVEAERAAFKLDKLGLVELHPKGRVKVLSARHAAWLQNGPLERQHVAALKEGFLAADFRQAGETFHFVTRHLSPRAIAAVERKIAVLLTEVRDLSEAEGTVGSPARKAMTYVVGARPWLSPTIAPFIR